MDSISMDPQALLIVYFKFAYRRETKIVFAIKYRETKFFIRRSFNTLITRVYIYN